MPKGKFGCIYKETLSYFFKQDIRGEIEKP